MDDIMRTTYVVCEVDGQRYAVSVSNVREIANISYDAELAGELPYYCIGTIVLRGETIPVVDLHLKMHLPAAAPDRHTKYLITQTNGKMIFKYAAYIVDKLFEVKMFPDEDILPAPAITSGNWQGYVTGAVKTEDGIVMILDSDRLLTEDFTGAADALAIRLAEGADNDRN